MSWGSREDLERSLSRFAGFVASESALYRRLTVGISSDDYLLELVSHARPGQPPANLILAAVHFLLLQGADSPLADFYPTVGGSLSPDEDTYRGFAEFCGQHRAEIVSLLETRRVQTNEPRRAAVLLPGFEMVSRLYSAPLATVEVGTSAGLLTIWDHYAYDYGSAGTFGVPGSRLVLHSDVQGSSQPPLGLPEKAWSAGIDTNPIDLGDDIEATWLRALVWPDQIERMHRLEAAIDIAREHPPRLVSGDGIEMLSTLIAEAPAEAVVVVHHSFALNQVTTERRSRFEAAVAGLADSHRVVLVSIEDWGEGWDRNQPFHLYVGEVERSRLVKREVAKVHHHGEWLEWIGGPVS